MVYSFSGALGAMVSGGFVVMVGKVRSAVQRERGEVACRLSCPSIESPRPSSFSFFTAL